MTKFFNLAFAVFFIAAVFRGCGPAAPASGAAEEETAVQSSPHLEEIDVDMAYSLYAQKGEQCFFIDVRTLQEYTTGHIDGAVNIPLAQIKDRMDEIPQGKSIIVYCDGEGCARSGRAARILIENGFGPVYDIGGGGIIEWMYKDYPHIRQ